MRYRNTVQEKDYDNKNRELHEKLDRGEQLTNDEAAFVCHCMKFDRLLLHPICLDEYFSRTFIFRNTDVPYAMYPIRDRDHIYYEGLVREWERVINQTNHKDQLMQIAATETREELRNLRKRYSVFHRAFSTPDYQNRKFKLLEWSKYRYIMIKDVFELSIRSNHYKLYLDGHQIIFDYYSLAHILTRHFGHPMKTYETDKSHFTQDIHHEEVHLRLEEIFKLIDESGVYANNPVEEINIRYNGNLYKIYCKEEISGSSKFLRLNTFFPIENNQMLTRLNTEYNENKISNLLSVFTKK